MSTDSLVGLGEASTICRAHGSRPVAISNPEFCLPTMNMRRSAYVSAGRSSPYCCTPSSASTLGRHGWATPTAKTTAGAMYSPSDVVSTKSLPSARVLSQRTPWRMRSPALCAKVARPFSISGRDGKYDVPSMTVGMIARSRSSSESRLFQSKRS